VRRVCLFSLYPPIR